MTENEFDQIQNEVSSEPTNDETAKPEVKESNLKEILPGDFSSVEYIKNPKPGETISLEVDGIFENKQTSVKTKDDIFNVGLKKSDGKYVRYDIHTTDNKVYTINSWEVYFKIMGKGGIAFEYGSEHSTYKGLKLKITRNVNAKYATESVDNIMKLEGLTKEEAEELQTKAKKARKENNVYKVERI